MALCGPSGVALADTFTVDSTADEPDATGIGGTCDSNFGIGGRCTLRAAFMEANRQQGNHTINLPAGTYTLTIPPEEEEEDQLGAGGALLTRFDTRITLVGAGASSTTIQGC